MKKIILFIISLCLLALPQVALAAYDGDLVINSANIRFSTNKFIEGQTIRIYATVSNPSKKDLLGTVKFFDTSRNKQIDGEQPISVFDGKTDDVFADFKLPAGTINIKVEIFPFEPGIDNPANNTAEKSIYVEQDFDKDGNPDITDQDDDNDGANDENDAFPKNSKEWADFDGDGIGNNADLDDDNDNIPDDKDTFPYDLKESVDTDKDEIGDNADADDDNDGLDDSKELAIGTNPLIPDTDNDGVIDGKDAFPLDPKESVDTDKDGIGNIADTDDDNDGMKDAEDKFPTNTAPMAIISKPGVVVQLGSEITFDPSKSTDKDGNIVKYTWYVNSNQLEGKTPSYKFLESGKYKIKLAVTDNAGETTATETTVYVASYKTYIKILIVVVLIALALTIGFQYTKRLKKPNLPIKKAKRK